MKRLDITLLLFLIVTTFSTKTYAYDIAVENADGVTIYYDYINFGRELSVTYRTTSYNSYTGSVVIPTEVVYKGETLKVTEIGDYAFSGSTGLTLIEIPSSVTSIDDYALEGCTGLTSINIPSSVTSIGMSTFYNCTSLTKVVVPDIVSWCSISFSHYPSNPLYYAHHLYSDDNTEITELVIPDGVNSIGSGAFYGCTELTSIEIPNSVASIGDWAFQGCTGLTVIEIPSSVTSIGSIAFSDCTGLTSINIPSSVTSIGNYAFGECTGLTSINIPSSVTSIGNSAFWKCTGLTSINIPSSVTLIGDRAFYGCTNLTSIHIPNSVTLIGDRAFYGCTNLTSIHIPNSVTSIGNYAFGECTGLTSIEIPSSVTEIGDWAFSGCDGLTKVIVPDIASLCGISFSGIRSNPLHYAHHLYSDDNIEITELVIPDGVTSIGNYVFSGCTELTSIEIPSSVTSIGSSAFSGCYFASYNFKNNSGLTDSKNWEATLYDEETSDGLLISSNQVVKCRANATSVVIPSYVTSIGDRAFYGCTSLTSINIPSCVTSIGDRAFYGCTNLTSIHIPSSVTSIGTSAFSGCYFASYNFKNNSGLTDSKNWGATLCDEETNGGLLISSNQIIKCRTNVSSVDIPSYVTSIGNSAFYYCTRLTSINIPSSVTEIGSSAFDGCAGITSIEIPSSVTLIGSGAFYGCKGLTSIEIPGSVTEIRKYAFYGCNGLTLIEIPSSVTSIGNYTFSGCTKLTAVVSHIENPFPITIDDILPFGSETFLYATLYVPEGTMEKYRATEGWKDFVHIVEGIPTPKCETPTVEYKNGKLLFGCATEGVEYHVSITSTGVTTGTVFDMPTTYIVKVYASKDGYEDSDEATITIKAADNNMDVNHDGRVDAQDASLIQQYVAGKVSL